MADTESREPEELKEGNFLAPGEISGLSGRTGSGRWAPTSTIISS